MTNRKAIIVDHSYHSKTGSSTFFHDLVKRCFGEVVIIWDESWRGGTRLASGELNAHLPDAIFFFQILYPANYFRELNCKRIYHVPMFDGSLGWSDLRWLKWHKLLFINFSSTLHRRFIALGMRSFYLQYYPECAPVTSKKARYGILWPHRSAVVNEQVVDALLGDSGESSIVIHEVNDPSVPEADPRLFLSRGMMVKQTNWFDSKEEYLAELEKARYFVAPREFEGIGFTFLEAMAGGSCVVAADRPTMNEYIHHGENGILFDPAAPSSIRSLGFDPDTQGDAARASVLVGRRKYLERAEALITALATASDSVFESKLNLCGLAARVRFYLSAALRNARDHISTKFAEHREAGEDR